jgi:hypothetical protein
LGFLSLDLLIFNLQRVYLKEEPAVLASLLGTTGVISDSYTSLSEKSTSMQPYQNKMQTSLFTSDS